MPKKVVNEARKHRRGPHPKDAAELRSHCVSVRLNAAELKTLDGNRGVFQRGEWLRMASIDQLPPSPPPALNREAWLELSRAAANLNQIARALNAGESVDVTDTLAKLAAFRERLIAV
jgi:hypothetical protein